MEKYRIWNGSEMEYSIVVGKYGVFYVNPEKGDGLDQNDSASLSPNTTKYQEDIPLMKYSRFVDKNDNEIYELDICKDDEGYNYIVEYDDGMFTFDAIPLYSVYKELEVIGNVYENPELMN